MIVLKDGFRGVTTKFSRAVMESGVVSSAAMIALQGAYVIGDVVVDSEDWEIGAKRYKEARLSIQAHTSPHWHGGQSVWEVMITKIKIREYGRVDEYKESDLKEFAELCWTRTGGRLYAYERIKYTKEAMILSGSTEAGDSFGSIRFTLKKPIYTDFDIYIDMSIHQNGGNNATFSIEADGGYGHRGHVSYFDHGGDNITNAQFGVVISGQSNEIKKINIDKSKVKFTLNLYRKDGVMGGKWIINESNKL